MNRRKFLTGLATVGGVSLAGCSALSDDTDELERQLEEKDETIANLEEERDELEEEIGELEQDIADAEGDISELEEQRETLIVERMTTLYGRAEVFFDLAEEAYSEGVTAIEQDTTEQDTRALNQFRGAWGSYDAATDLTFEIVELADDEGYSDAADLATDANQYASNMRDACDEYAVAAQNFLLDNIEAGNQNLSTGDTAFNEAQQHTFVSSTVFDNTLSS